MLMNQYVNINSESLCYMHLLRFESSLQPEQLETILQFQLLSFTTAR